MLFAQKSFKKKKIKTRDPWATSLTSQNVWHINTFAQSHDYSITLSIWKKVPLTHASFVTFLVKIGPVLL